MAIQAEDAIDRIQRIDELFQHWLKQLAGVQSGQPEKVLELFVENSFWTVSKIAETLKVAYTTARRALDRLESVGIVMSVGTAKRNRVYCARAMFEILEAPYIVGPDDSEGGDFNLRNC
jgi:Fic family protein